MPFGRLLAVLIFSCWPGAAALGQAAHFWLSEVASGSTGPEAPSVAAPVGVPVKFHVWGRPTPGRQFVSVSLDIAMSATGADFLDGSYVFHNEINGSTDRFDFVRDSFTFPDLTSDLPGFIVAGGAIDSLRGLNGVTVVPAAGIRGPGPACAAGETNCEIAGDGDPAWLLAEFEVDPLSAGASVDLFLRVGARGVVERTLAPGDYDMAGAVGLADHAVWAASYGSTTDLAADGNADDVVNAADYTVWRDHLGEVAVEGVLADTDVMFGVDGMGGAEPTYDAEDPADRETTLFGDDPDASLAIVAPTFSVPEPGGFALVGAVLGGGLIKNGRRRPTRLQKEN